MTTAHTLTTSITGRPAVYIVYREVWADQVDNHGDACPVCQLEGRMIECNVYVPTDGGNGVLLSACRCCAPSAVLDHAELNPGRDAIIEYAKEN
jgi:hypothetical protein